MRIEIEISQEDRRAIAREVMELLKPLLADPEGDEVFDVRGLAAYLKVSNKWIYERTHLKEIPHIKIKGQLRFRKKDIDRWLESCGVPAAGQKSHIRRVK
jgi:excisionase family DNA binding protein